MIAAAVECHQQLFPGAVTEWSDEDYGWLRGYFELKQEAEKKALDDAKEEADQKKAEATKKNLPPGTKTGGGAAGRTSAHPIVMPLHEGEE